MSSRAGHAGSLEEACEGAIAFLKRTQATAGYWLDFAESTEWVTAYVTAELAGVVEMESCLTRASDWLHRTQRQSGGWAYSQRHPADCDSTSWAVLALANTGRLSFDIAERARSFILKHQCDENGGFATHVLSTAGASTYEPDRRPAWFTSHTCVSAVALQALTVLACKCEDRIEMGLRFLSTSRGRDGLWNGYWWSTAFGGGFGVIHSGRPV